MAIIGIQVNRNNPPFTLNDFKFWMPQFKDVTDIQTYFDKLYPLANQSVFKSVFGVDWERAMSLYIAHQIQLIANQLEGSGGHSITDVPGGTAIRGVLTSAQIGNFSKQIDVDKTIITEDEAKWWNLTSYGQEFYALWRKHPWPSIAVITSGPITPCPEHNHCHKKDDIDI